ncbi:MULTISPECIES: Na(+)-translocating NADH-quinone reductase subunit C [Alteromonas]|uniref:Na(+)-translocating NADH-quinone reductase subunit C n=4 Tax=root TaxID=1 RepID=A0AAC8XM86_9ALTE|nr:MULTISPECIES: Na(+)-translocating NADH-quinone reductase subunit C [Alteromonas]AGP79215.1 Na(+)-translocating NADH-quinone reductase subunit C [Alteromonas mediterranea 615]AGP95015.1 Na(+)-translocating NADH-quinone reductase subunit C [Alteromonas mediterranea U8]MBR9785699.1 Na(+)-translocating NADH-quinone reductase subunit C [Gammaproteobacteria bacterium]AFV86952.1 Na(+)-translocating NADH-quinone reductase subunit C [Alteromonas mediterranea DE1]AGP83198.1 Na(+)-translocating NADH-q
MSAKKESLGKTIGVVVAVCLVCSIVVSGAAVGLRSLQQTNAALDKKSNILNAAGLYEMGMSNNAIESTYSERVEQRYVNLEEGTFVEAPAPDYDMYKAAKQTEYSTKVTNSNVGFQRRPNVASVYLVRNEAGDVSRIILPVHGSGLWDLMYGFLAIDADGQTVRELIYYQQKETPGLGGEVQNPAWQDKWDGKELYENGEVAIRVVKNANPSNPHTIDALSGATLTSNGVENTIRYWVGEQGFGQFLKNQAWRS